MSQQGFLCTQCSAETPCTPEDFTGMNPRQVNALLVNWRCGDCLDLLEAEEAESAALKGASPSEGDAA